MIFLFFKIDSLKKLTELVKMFNEIIKLIGLNDNLY